MAMVDVVYWLATAGLISQVEWLGPKVGGNWQCFCSHGVNRVTSRSALSMVKHKKCRPGIIISLLQCRLTVDLTKRQQEELCTLP